MPPIREFPMLPPDDTAFVQLVDAALASAVTRSGSWLACRPGCSQCCIGIFAISTLDAERLRNGLRELQGSDAPRAERILQRVSASCERLAESYPGDLHTGILYEDEAAEEVFADLGNDEPCPVLDPITGTCDLYFARPMTCRIFGPPVRSEEGLGVCELCFQGASEQEIAQAEMVLPAPEIEERLTVPLGSGRTTVAFALNSVTPAPATNRGEDESPY